MYEAFNDCSAMKKLVRENLVRRDPSQRSVRVSTEENNCRNAEYDLHFTVTSTSEEEESRVTVPG